MAIHFNEGEVKKRPGVFQRQSNIGVSIAGGAKDGICAIPIRAAWGPLGKVIKNSLGDLTKNYGSGTYGTNYTVPAAQAMFDGGAATVYTYRLGSGGAKASKEIAEGLTVTAMYPGTMPISVAVQAKLGDSTRKQILVYTGTTLVETFEFAANSTSEGANLVAAVAGSKYITASGSAATVPALAVASGALTGGEDPEVTNEEYSKAYDALEPYYYNTTALDVDDDESMTLSLLLQAYMVNANQLGKSCIAVVGEKVTVDFADRCAHSRAFNDAYVVYLGNGWKVGTKGYDGVLGICYTAGVIASTPSNQSITHAVIKGATDLCESRSYAEYVDAIDAGMLMVSMSSDGSIWYDSGINTLVNPDDATQDDGWKKIRRVKVRLEAFNRLDRALEPKVGRLSAGTDGVADIIQTGQRVMDAMVKEGKLNAGASFLADPAHPVDSDSAWFVIQMDDIDSLEKIYLHYQFRYSQNV